MKLKSLFFPAVARTAAACILIAFCAASKADSVPGPTAPVKTTASSIVDSFRLRLHHLHTGESIDVAYKRAGDYDSGAVNMLNHFLRDHRTEDTADYDPREFDLLHSLLVKLGRPNAVIDIVCGYRTPQSNNFLRTRNSFTGVAEHSQHMLSKAIDIRIPGVSTLALRNAALSLGMGGVGYYPVSQFVHVDVGPVRQWQFGGARQMMEGLRNRVHSARSRHGRHRA